ncbi:hypothetical protein Tco_1209154 [Tanacetum coccineum]
MAISSSSSSSSSDSEVQKCSKQCLDSFKTLQKNYDTEREKHNKAKLEIRGYEIALESLEYRILGHEKNELAWGTGPNWMFDLDFLTNSMNYIPVSVENQVNVDADKDIQDSEDVIDKEGQHQMPEDEQVLHDELEKMKAAQATSTNTLSTDRPSVSTANTPYVSAASTPTGANAGESSFAYLGGKIPIDASTFLNADLPIDPNMPDLEDAYDTLPNDGIFNGAGLPSVSTARPVCTAKPNVSTARPVYATRPIYPRMDNVRPRGSCLPIKRSYYTKPAFRPKDLKQDVKTFGVQNMTTARTRAVVNTGKGKLDTDFKKSRWVWRPKGNYLDHVSKDSGSFMLKKGNPEILLQDHAVVDSGCSSHMTGNKAYLSDYEDFNGGFVAFGSDPKGGASLDRKSTIGGCQFLGRRLISWQCKKQTIMENSTTEAEYVAAVNCYRQVLWLQNHMMNYGFNFMNTKIHIDNESTISVIKNPVDHSRTKHIEIRFHFIRDCYEKRLIEVIKNHTDSNIADLLTKGFDVTRFNFLVVSIGI